MKQLPETTVTSTTTTAPVKKKKTMTMTAFIKANKSTIDAVIRKSGYEGRLNNEERSDWIANDEGLYNAAIAAGVEV